MRSGENIEVTQLLKAMQSGDGQAYDRLFPLVYDELLGIARHKLNQQYAEQTLDSVALVNEVYLKLAGGVEIHSRNRAQFFALASKAMRRILIDRARHKNRLKRGGGARP